MSTASTCTSSDPDIGPRVGGPGGHFCSGNEKPRHPVRDGGAGNRLERKCDQMRSGITLRESVVDLHGVASTAEPAEWLSFNLDANPGLAGVSVACEAEVLQGAILAPNGGEDAVTHGMVVVDVDELAYVCGSEVGELHWHAFLRVRGHR